MKKALMFLGLALCASVAFAQTESASRVAKAAIANDLKQAHKIEAASVDYKASIFTKEEGADTLHTFTFAPQAMTGISYGTDAVLSETDVINDTATAGMAHTVPLEKDVWTRISDSAWFSANFATTYPGAANFMGPLFVLNRLSTVNNPGASDDGFMFLSLSEQTTLAGNFNAYFTLPPVNKADNTIMVEVRLTQAYIKYYDRCYIDYKIGDNWYAREINVEGVDVGINEVAAYHPYYTMPATLASQDQIELRIRALSWGRGAAYGYAWAVDNVAVVSVTREDRWTLSGSTAFDGLFGMVPQGMKTPITYGINVRNLGVAELRNAKLTLSAGSSKDNLNEVLSTTPQTIPAGNINHDYRFIINERGFIHEDSALNNNLQGWLGEFENYGNTTGNLIGGYQARSLPTNTIGQNYYTMTATATNNRNSNTLTARFDTVLYTVSDFLEVPQSGRIEGFRWGRDNGLIPSGSIFCSQFTDGGYITSDTSDNHYTGSGYRVHVRYTTGNTVPNDWRFRGIEIVPQTLYDTARMRGTTIVPIVYEESYTDDGYVHWNTVPCGIDDLAFPVDGSMANDLSTGYILPDVDYNAINIRFPQQPKLKPNTAYRFGYIINTDGYFAAAAQATRYITLNEEQERVWTYYYENPETAPYYYQNMGSPSSYDIMVGDPLSTGSSSTVYGSYIDNAPLIRPIVGEPMDIPTTNITIDCNNNHDTIAEDGVRYDIGFYVQYGTDSICNSTIPVAVGSAQRINIYPAGDHSVISHVYLNGEELMPYDDVTGEGDLEVGEYNVIDENDNSSNPWVYLTRDYYSYYIPEVAAGTPYVITATTHYEPHAVAIDPVAPEVGLSLAPNPATSTVKLNISGVSGMVNCNIIDMSGRVIYNANINAEGQNTINVSNFPAGAYFVRITNSTFSKIEKLIIR